MWTYRARVGRIIDGDTIEAVLDLGLTVTVTVRLRLEGVWAAERSADPERRAAGELQRWLDENGDGTQWPVVVRTTRQRSDASEVRTLERYVATITSRTGASLNRHMVGWLAANGLAGGIGA